MVDEYDTTLKRGTDNPLQADRATEAGDQAEDGLQDGREAALADDREAALNDGKDTREKATGDTGKGEAELGNKTEDSLEDDGKLALETDGTDNAVAGTKDFEDENVDEGEDAGNLAALELEAGGAGERGDDRGEAALELLDETKDGLDAGLRLDFAGSDSSDGGVCAIG